MHAHLDDWTRFFIALGPVLGGLAAVISALNNRQHHIQGRKIDQLSKDVNGRVNELVDAKAAAAKLEVIQAAGITPRGHNTRWNDDPLAKEPKPAVEIVKEAVKEAITEVNQGARSEVPKE